MAASKQSFRDDLREKVMTAQSDGNQAKMRYFGTQLVLLDLEVLVFERRPGV